VERVDVLRARRPTLEPRIDPSMSMRDADLDRADR
jgi:hypothetical protein